MKLTVYEFNKVLDAVYHERHRVAKESVLCAGEGRKLTARYYGDMEQEYKALFNKLVDMMNDITE